MAEPYVGEIRMFAGAFAPSGWAFCDGQLMSIDENDTLFTLIGTTYGGDGVTNFALPDLRGRVPIHMGISSASGAAFQLGERAGFESVTLSVDQTPNHTHILVASTESANQPNPSANQLASSNVIELFSGDSPDATALSPNAIQPVGGSQPHENMMPFCCVNFIISLFGIFPSQT